MRISTSHFYDRASQQMARLGAGADQLQTQIATGKKLIGAADDPAGYQLLGALRRDAADDGAFGNNVALAQGLLAQTDGTLSSVETQLQRARELAINANNDTLSPEGREAIAIALDGVLEDLFGLANTSDARGQPLFGGTADAAAFTRNADGSIAFSGGGTPPAIPIGADNAIRATESGDRVFGGAGSGSDIFTTIAVLVRAVRSGDNAATAVAGSNVGDALSHIASVRGSVGARAVRLDLEAARLENVEITRETERSRIEDVDIATAITQLQKTLTVLQATQASFARLSGLTLFDQL